MKTHPLLLLLSFLLQTALAPAPAPAPATMDSNPCLHRRRRRLNYTLPNPSLDPNPSILTLLPLFKLILLLSSKLFKCSLDPLKPLSKLPLTLLPTLIRSPNRTFRLLNPCPEGSNLDSSSMSGGILWINLRLTPWFLFLVRVVILGFLRGNLKFFLLVFWIFRRSLSVRSPRWFLTRLIDLGWGIIAIWRMGVGGWRLKRKRKRLKKRGFTCIHRRLLLLGIVSLGCCHCFHWHRLGFQVHLPLLEFLFRFSSMDFGFLFVFNFICCCWVGDGIWWNDVNEEEARVITDKACNDVFSENDEFCFKVQL